MMRGKEKRDKMCLAQTTKMASSLSKRQSESCSLSLWCNCVGKRYIYIYILGVNWRRDITEIIVLSSANSQVRLGPELFASCK